MKYYTQLSGFTLNFIRETVRSRMLPKFNLLFKDTYSTTNDKKRLFTHSASSEFLF